MREARDIFTMLSHVGFYLPLRGYMRVAGDGQGQCFLFVRLLFFCNFFRFSAFMILAIRTFVQPLEWILSLLLKFMRTAREKKCSKLSKEEF